MITVHGIWPLRLATIWFEPVESIRPFLQGYARTHVYSYQPLELPAFHLLKEKPTPFIPLSGTTAEEVLSSFRDTTRNEVRRTFKMPELSFTIQRPDAETYAFYAAATRSQGRRPQRAGLFRDARVAVARRAGVVLSTIAFVPAKPVVKVLTISSLRRESADAQERNLIGFASKRLIYELCAYGIDNGYDGVDLGYVNLTDAAKRGISDFKTGFGGEVRTEWQYVRESRLVALLRRCRSYL